jgi:hypothetical protein
MRGGGRRLRGLSCAHGAQINFADLTPYLTMHTVIWQPIIHITTRAFSCKKKAALSQVDELYCTKYFFTQTADNLVNFNTTVAVHLL